VYEKGAEVIRMMHTWIGADAFVAGLDLYFARHDHGAATVEDLIACLAEASGQDLSLFLRWYDQPGTPVLRATCVLVDGQARLGLSQTNPRAPADAGPLPMPVVVSFIDADGETCLIRDPGIECTDASRTLGLLKLTQAAQDFVITGIPADATVCWLGGFSAPVILETEDDVPSMLRRAAAAPDPYNRWDAGNSLMLTLVRQDLEGATPPVFADYLEAVRAQLDAVEDPSFTALVLAWPRDLTFCQDLCPAFPIERVLASRAAFLRETGRALDATLQEHFLPLHAALPARWDLETSGRRALKNTLFALWARQCNDQTRALARSWYGHATNMTDRIAALSVLCLEASPDRDEALADFFERFGHDFTMLTTWFSVQASAAAPDTFEKVQQLVAHPAFDWTNPNKIRAVIRAFAANLGHFHRADGAGYDFVGDAVLRLNDINPQIAAGMVGSFSQTGLLDPSRLRRLRGVLESLAGTPGMKDKVLEQVNRILGA
jgi:aminopeptidase N